MMTYAKGRHVDIRDVLFLLGGFMKSSLEQYINGLKRENRIRKDISARLQNNGYETIETSLFEPYDGFLQCHGRSSKDRTVKVVNNRGGIEILRPDITFNIIKKLAGYYKQDEQVKLSYDSVVFMNDTDGGISETRQLGAEYVGTLSIDADLEIIQIVNQLLDQTETSVLIIGHTKYVKGLLSEVVCSDDMKQNLIQALYNRQPDQLNRLLATVTLSDEVEEKIKMLLDVDLYELDDFSKGFMNSDMKIAIRELMYLKECLDDHISFDLSLISQYDYYNGIIFKGFGKGVNQAVVKGGRYDKLSKLFNANIPAVGFSLELKDYMKIVRL